MRRAAPLAIGIAACACNAQTRLPDVLLVSVDTLRPDHLGLYGYTRATSPRLDRWFSERSVVYANAYSTESSTPPSVVSMLAGSHPPEHGVRFFFQKLPPSVALIPDRLPPAYQSAAFVSNMVLADRALGIAQRFDHYDDRVDQQDPLPWTKRSLKETCPEPNCYWQAAITPSGQTTRALPRTFRAGRTLTPEIREQLEALGYVVD